MKNLEDGHSKCSVVNNESTPNLVSTEVEKSIFGQSGGVGSFFSRVEYVPNTEKVAHTQGLHFSQKCQNKIIVVSPGRGSYSPWNQPFSPR